MLLLLQHKCIKQRPQRGGRSHSERQWRRHLQNTAGFCRFAEIRAPLEVFSSSLPLAALSGSLEIGLAGSSRDGLHLLCKSIQSSTT